LAGSGERGIGYDLGPSGEVGILYICTPNWKIDRVLDCMNEAEQAFSTAHSESLVILSLVGGSDRVVSLEQIRRHND